MRAMPHLRLEIHEMPVGEHAHRLRSGQIDLAYGHKGEDAEGIQFSLLTSEPLLIGLPSSHALATRSHLTISELSNESFVFWHRSISPACHDYIMQIIRSQAAELETKHLAPDHGKLLEMVATGLGWTVAPACAHRAHYPGVRFRKIRGIQTKMDLAPPQE